MFYIPVGVIAGIIYLFSSIVAGWFVWVFAVVLALNFLITSLIRRNSFRKGESMPPGEIILIAYVPFSCSIILLSGIALLFVDVSKLHLLRVALLVNTVVEVTIGRRVSRMIWERELMCRLGHK